MLKRRLTLLWLTSYDFRLNLLQVIGRFAVAGSTTLSAFLGVVRRADSLTSFDIILLTHLMGKSTENEVR